MSNITRFRARWNYQQRVGQIITHSAAGSMKTLSFHDASEFNALLNILSAAGQAREHDGWIETDPENIDGG